MHVSVEDFGLLDLESEDAFETEDTVPISLSEFAKRQAEYQIKFRARRDVSSSPGHISPLPDPSLAPQAQRASLLWPTSRQIGR